MAPCTDVPPIRSSLLRHDGPVIFPILFPARLMKFRPQHLPPPSTTFRHWDGQKLVPSPLPPIFRTSESDDFPWPSLAPGVPFGSARPTARVPALTHSILQHIPTWVSPLRCRRTRGPLGPLAHEQRTRWRWLLGDHFLLVSLPSHACFIDRQRRRAFLRSAQPFVDHPIRRYDPPALDAELHSTDLRTG